MKELRVDTDSRTQFVEITDKVRNALQTSGDELPGEGWCRIYVPHTTAAVTINEAADPDVPRDIAQKLDDLVPRSDAYRHMEGNADSHIKSSIIGNTCEVMISDGSLQLGRWQGIFFCEFDGPRNRRVWIQLD